MISFVNTNKTASIDSVLEESSIRDLVHVKQAKTSSLVDGARVYAYHNNGMIIPGNLPSIAVFLPLIVFTATTVPFVPCDGKLPGMIIPLL